MTFNASKQTTYLILESLSEGSKYGLEIIEYISAKTNRQLNLKKPTLYSCLTRIEKKGLILSSFWGESEFGGKRHYYSITQDGKRELEVLSAEYKNALRFGYKPVYDTSELNSHFEIEEDFQNEEFNKNIEYKPFESKNLTVNSDNDKAISEQTQTEEKPSSPVFIQQDNLFNHLKTTETKPKETGSAESVVENQIDIFSALAQKNKEEQNDTQEQVYNLTTNINENSNNTEEINANEADETENNIYFKPNTNETITAQTNTSEESEIAKDDAKFLEPQQLTLSAEQKEQNKRLFDTSSELKKYRKRKSFSENQIEMAVQYETQEDIMAERERFAALKSSLLSSRQAHQETVSNNNNPSYASLSQQQSPNNEQIYNNAQNAQNTQNAQVSQESPNNTQQNVSAHTSSESKSEEEHTDDGIFITSRIDSAKIPVQRKIAPTNISVEISPNNLPAPKRDTELEPTYKDMLNKLFEQKQKTLPNEVIEEQITNNFADYNSLNQYYKNHGIEFKVYHKSNVERSHNTNFLSLISAVILFLLSGIGSAVLFGVISACGTLTASTNWLFYTVPCIFAVLLAYQFARFKLLKSNKPVLTYNVFIVWAVFVLFCVITVVVNILCGMQVETIGKFLTPLLMPILAVLLILPVNHHLRKFIFRKYGK